jgi:scyllo-inositol 2-dehydrogenase (NAD+)
MTGKVNCAVLGVGRLGWHHAENLAGRIAGASLQAVADIDPRRAELFARRYEIPRYTSDIDAVLEDSTIDAVVIVTPTTTHSRLIRKAIAAGKAVFVEKPITLSLEEAQDIDRMVQQTHGYCQVGFMRRFDPSYSIAAEEIRRGAIGKPLYFKAVSRDPGCPPESYIRESGRLFLDMSIHDYDIARFLMNDEVLEATAMGAVVKNDFLRGYDDIDQALTFVRFTGGALGDIEGSRNAGYGYDIRAEVVGSEGTIQIGSLDHNSVRLLNHSGATHDIMPSFLERFASAYLLEMTEFVECVRSSAPPPVTVEDGWRAVAIGLAATRSFDEQRSVPVDYGL